MTWKLWIVVAIGFLGMFGNLMDLWNPKEYFRDEDKTRKIALLALFVQMFVLWAIFSSVATKCLVE